MMRLTLNRIAIKGISQHKTPFIAKLPHANLAATDKKRHFRFLFRLKSVTDFLAKNHDSVSGRQAKRSDTPSEVILSFYACRCRSSMLFVLNIIKNSVSPFYIIGKVVNFAIQNVLIA